MALAASLDAGAASLARVADEAPCSTTRSAAARAGEQLVAGSLVEPDLARREIEHLAALVAFGGDGLAHDAPALAVVDDRRERVDDAQTEPLPCEVGPAHATTSAVGEEIHCRTSPRGAMAAHMRSVFVGK